MTPLEAKLQALVAELRKLRQGWDDLADAMDGHHSFDFRCGLQQCEAELGLFIPKLEALLAERRPVVTVTHGSVPSCTADAIRESGKWKTFEYPALAERQERPFLFAIEDRQGNWHDGEQCVFGDAESAQEEVDLLNDDFDEGEQEYKVVPLYRATEPSSGTGESKGVKDGR